MMKAEHAIPYQKRLVAMRAKLRGDVRQMTGVGMEIAPNRAGGDWSSVPTQLADVGTDNFDSAFTLALMEGKSRTLDQIEKALDRIEHGIYGLCETCSAKIPKARLNVLPHTILCVKCASQ